MNKRDTNYEDCAAWIKAESLDTLSKLPATNLIDGVTNASWPLEMRQSSCQYPSKQGERTWDERPRP